MKTLRPAKRNNKIESGDCRFCGSLFTLYVARLDGFLGLFVVFGSFFDYFRLLLIMFNNFAKVSKNCFTFVVACGSI